MSQNLARSAYSNGMAALAFVLFGSTAFIVKPSSLSADNLIAGRFLVCLLCSAPCVILNRSIRALSLRTLSSIALTALLVLTNLLLLFRSIKLIPTTLAVPIYFSGPLYTTLIESVIKREDPNWLKVISIFFAATGLAASMRHGVLGTNSVAFEGVLSACAAGAIFGLVPVAQRHIVGVKPLETLFYQSLIIVAVFTPTYAGLWRTLTPSNALEIGFLGVLFTFVPFLLWWKAIGSASKVNPFVAYLDPITSIAIGLLFLGERLGTMELFGVTLLASALLCQILSELKPRRLPLVGDE